LLIFSSKSPDTIKQEQRKTCPSQTAMEKLFILEIFSIFFDDNNTSGIKSKEGYNIHYSKIATGAQETMVFL